MSRHRYRRSSRKDATVPASPRLRNSPQRARAARGTGGVKRPCCWAAQHRTDHPRAPGHLDPSASVTQIDGGTRIAVSLPVTIRDRYLMQSIRGSRAKFFQLTTGLWEGSIVRKLLVTNPGNGEPVDRHLSVFLPYDRPPHHEDQHTRAAMIVMRTTPWPVTVLPPHGRAKQHDSVACALEVWPDAAASTSGSAVPGERPRRGQARSRATPAAK